MPGTMTYVGFDVHARSTHAAAIDVMTGELTRMRFGAGIDAPVDWLKTLSGPVRACYEAGPTGYGLYRAAVAAGVGIEVIAGPRVSGGRVRPDRLHRWCLLVRFWLRRHDAECSGGLQHLRRCARLPISLVQLDRLYEGARA